MEKNHSLNLNTVATKKKIGLFSGSRPLKWAHRCFVCMWKHTYAAAYSFFFIETIFTKHSQLKSRLDTVSYEMCLTGCGSRFYIGFNAVVRLHLKHMRRPQKKIQSKNVNRNSKFSIGIAGDTKIYCHLAEIHQKMAQVKDFFNFRSMGKEWNHWNTCFCFRSVS